MFLVFHHACVSFFQVLCVNSFSQMLRRYTSLNHLAQAAHAVLQNSAHINQMLSDLNRVDFNNVQVRAAFNGGGGSLLRWKWRRRVEL